MSELFQIIGHDQTPSHEDEWAEKARGKKLILVDLANCEDMNIKKRRSINVYGFPIGIMCLATYLKKYLTTLDIKLMDFGVEYSSEEELIEIIKKEKPDFVGFRAVSANRQILQPLLHQVRQFCPDALLMVGGPYVSEKNTDEFIETDADLFFIGEAEASLLEVMKRVLDNKDYSDVSGISLNKKEHYVDNKPVFRFGRMDLVEFDNLGFPDYNMVDFPKYYESFNWGYSRNKYALMESTRGCPYSCTYCHVIFGKKTRFRTPESVVNEIKNLQKNQDITDLFFTDDIFNIDMRRATEIFDRIIDEKIKVRIQFPNGLRGDIMTEEFVVKMVEAGTISVAYAFETPSQRMQKYMKKNVHLEKLKKIVDYTCSKGIMVRLFFMYGFPTETEEDVNYTIEYMKQFKNVVSPYFFALKYYKDTEMYDQAISEGYKYNALDESAKGLYTEFQFSATPMLSKEFMKKVHYRWLSEVILDKERFMNALSIQRNFHTDEEITAYYSSFFGKDFDSIDAILNLCRTTDNHVVPHEEVGLKLT